MYSKLYSPNIIATGSSEIDESSYSHHADNDVGVAVIDRYTYYNLDFLENHVGEPSSKLTLGDLFDSYDEAKIHSHPGVRWDLFPGGQSRGRERLVMDFFGNVQNVEIEPQAQGDDMDKSMDLVQLGKLVSTRLAVNQTALRGDDAPSRSAGSSKTTQPPNRIGAAKVLDADRSWQPRIVGFYALAICSFIWLAASWIDSSDSLKSG